MENRTSQIMVAGRLIGEPEGSAPSRLVARATTEIGASHRDKLYHCLGHTLGEMSRTMGFLDIVSEVRPELLSKGARDLGRIAGAYHDIYQDFDEVDGKRVRRSPHNEMMSAERATEDMRTERRSDGSPYYSDSDIVVVADAIHHTIPAWDVENRTVYQPALNPESPIISRAHAYADIGTAAIDGPAAAISDADTLFFENNIDFLRMMRAGPLTMADQKLIRDHALAWLQLQEGFIAGRRMRLDLELAGLPNDLKRVLNERYFVHFDESLVAMRLLLEERRRMSFGELVRSMGL